MVCRYTFIQQNKMIMKKIILLCVLCIMVGKTFAQKQAFEFTTYIAPKAWKKEVKANTYTSYSIINNHSWW